MEVSFIYILAVPEVDGRSRGETVPQIDERLHDAFSTETGHLIRRAEPNIRKALSRWSVGSKFVSRWVVDPEGKLWHTDKLVEQPEQRRGCLCALVATGLRLLATETLYSGRRALTIDHLQALCLSLTEQDLKRLVSKMGIEVSSPDKRDVRMGILGILMVWFKAQKSAEEAHKALTTTLKRIGLKFVAQLINSNSLEILLKNLDLTLGRKSTEQKSIPRTESESREPKVAKPNPLCNSALPAPESVSTSVSIPDPRWHVVSDSILLSAPEILESELAFSSESEAHCPLSSKGCA